MLSFMLHGPTGVCFKKTANHQINQQTCKPPEVQVGVRIRMTVDRTNGRVTLVGVGPGDIKHITPEGRAAIETADVILYDRLIGPEVLSLAPSSAKLESVGKGKDISRSQRDVNDLIITHAQAGHHVVRLKGGDTGIFARLGPELSIARQTGIDVKVVPGVTTASAVAALLQFSLTEKGIANSVCFVSARDGADWVTPNVLRHVTVVVYMGLGSLQSFSERLVSLDASCAGISAVAVQAATTPTQKVVWGTVGTLFANVCEAGLVSPTLIIFGEVVRLAKDWPNNIEKKT